MILKKYIFAFIFSITFIGASAQIFDKHGNEMILVNIAIEDGDTIPVLHMNQVMIVAKAGKKNTRFNSKLAILKRRVIKVYPYAQEAKKLLAEYEKDLALVDTKKDKKKYVKKAEKKLKEEFSGVLRDMTVSEGKILIKLIDRETSNTSYQLIDELRGGGSAFMWQGIARLFGSNLKAEYDPLGDDFLIERIVQGIETGKISLASK